MAIDNENLEMVELLLDNKVSNCLHVMLSSLYSSFVVGWGATDPGGPLWPLRWAIVLLDSKGKSTPLIKRMVIDNKNLEIVLFNAFLPGHKLKRLHCWANQVDKPDWVLGPRWATVLPKDYGCIVTKCGLTVLSKITHFSIFSWSILVLPPIKIHHRERSRSQSLVWAAFGTERLFSLF